jgi:hypothetical protein
VGSFFKIEFHYESSLCTEPAHKRLMNRLYREAMQRHKEKILPRHFEKVPETEPHGAYGYAPRSRRWKNRKARQGKDPDRPLVYTGLMRTIVIRESVVRATKDHATLTAKNHYPMSEQRRREVEAISDREIFRMAGRMKQDYMQLVKTPEFARRRGVRRIGATP